MTMPTIHGKPSLRGTAKTPAAVIAKVQHRQNLTISNKKGYGKVPVKKVVTREKKTSSIAAKPVIHKKKTVGIDNKNDKNRPKKKDSWAQTMKPRDLTSKQVVHLVNTNPFAVKYFRELALAHLSRQSVATTPKPKGTKATKRQTEEKRRPHPPPPVSSASVAGPQGKAVEEGMADAGAAPPPMP
jgi:hypothetical protein